MSVHPSPQAKAGLSAKLKGAVRRVRRLIDPPRDFRGAFASHGEALAAVPKTALAGYDHDEVADVAFELMCQLRVWDYPILFWLERLLPAQQNLIDAGGHMGTKFRAFRHHLTLPADFDWAIYDVPAIVRAGRARAARDGLTGMSFHDSLEHTPPSDVLLCSGLLQYLDIPFSTFLQRLPRKPRHLLLNKVATHEKPSVFTLEAFPTGEVPYQIRNEAEFVASLSAAGYRIVDGWDIPSLSHASKAFGVSTSRGYYATLA